MNDLPLHIPLEGCSNLRDLGGWPLAGGRRVRRGVVFRSASLARLTPADVATVAALGIRTVCDFRGEREAQVAPSVLPEGVTLLKLPIEPQVGASLRDLVRREQSTGEDVVALLGQAYLAYVSSELPRFRALFDTVLDPARRAVLFHCSAGKDRTGLAAALLLTALGAEPDVVMADYVATDRLWQREFSLPAETPAALAAALYATHPALLTAALAAAVEPFGGQDAFLEHGLGLDAPRLAALREALID